MKRRKRKEKEEGKAGQHKRGNETDNASDTTTPKAGQSGTTRHKRPLPNRQRGKPVRTTCRKEKEKQKERKKGREAR